MLLRCDLKNIGNVLDLLVNFVNIELCLDFKGLLMKKLIIAIYVLCIMPCFALMIDYTTDGSQQALVYKIGFRILNANNIHHRMVFYARPEKKMTSAHTNLLDRQIVIYGGIITYADSEEELAAIIAHEISHVVDSYNGIFRGYFSLVANVLAPKKYDYLADKRAIDYMVNANYNPLAFIVMMNKVGTQFRYDMLSMHPLTSRRLMAAYEYIYMKYPEYLVQNKYKDNIYYQNFLLTSKENRRKFQEKIKNNSKKQVRYL